MLLHSFGHFRLSVCPSLMLLATGKSRRHRHDLEMVGVLRGGTKEEHLFESHPVASPPLSAYNLSLVQNRHRGEDVLATYGVQASFKLSRKHPCAAHCR
jgi:hypothetical protein